MARLSICTGPQGKFVLIDALPFLPGLFMHKTPGGARTESDYNITHVSSGLAVLAHVPEKFLELARMILGRIDWTKVAGEIYENKNYYIVIEEAEAVLTNHEISKKQETRIADDLDGKRQPASGSRWGYKRDVVTPSILVEAKTTKSDRVSLSLKDLDFLRKQAYSQGKVPAYIIELRKGGEIAIVPKQELEESHLSSFSEVRALGGRPPKKSFTVTLHHVQKLLSGAGITFTANSNEYILMSYEKFLEFAKGI